VAPIRPGVDLESYGLSRSAAFIELVNRSWADYQANGGVTLESLRAKATETPRTRPPSVAPALLAARTPVVQSDRAVAERRRRDQLESSRAW
jgi:hypothetical protein